MATAGEGTTGSASAYKGGGGAGGKFRKRPFRRAQTTPYDRPPTALRNPTQNSGWLSKLVDPASKLISAGAHMFSSVFRQRLPPALPLPPPPEENQVPRDRLQDMVTNNLTGAEEATVDEGGNPTSSSDGGGISGLEQILKQKRFTRSEIDRLTELLHARTVELPVADERKRAEVHLSKPISDFERHKEFTSSAMLENKNERDGFRGITSTPLASSRVLEEDVASPAEIAKAYMGGRPSKVSPSMLGLRNQAPRDDASFLKNVPFPAKSSIAPLAPKTAGRVVISENGFVTPRSRGRSAIHSMARAPYSRVHSTATQKDTGPASYGYGGPSSSSQHAWDPEGQLGSKQVALKRRSSVLDDDIGSVGPIRRIRQKPNLLSQGTDFAQCPISSTQKLLLTDESKHKISKTVGGIDNDIIPSSSYTPVPNKSSEMAAKILQHLEKLTPKEKSSESKLVAARGKSPTKLTPNMLCGHALRSLDDVDSSKFLLSAHDSRKLEDLDNTCLPDARDSTSLKQDKVDKNDSKKLTMTSDVLIPAVNSHSKVSVKDTVPVVEKADSVIAKFSSQPPQKKRAFQMSAHEDSLELDDDVYSNGPASAPRGEVRERRETSVVESKAVSTEVITLDRTPVLPEVQTFVNSVLNKKTAMETSEGSVIGEKNTLFTFPNSSAPSATFLPGVLTQSTSVVDNIVPPKESSAPPIELPPFAFSSSSSFIESSGAKSSSWSDPKAESSNSLANVTSGATEYPVKIPESDKGDDRNNQKTGDIMGKSDALPSSVSTSMSTSSIFSFGAPVNNSKLNNGSLASSPSVFTATDPFSASSNFTNQIFNKSSFNVASSVSTATMSTSGTATAVAASSSSLSTSAATPTAAAPIFKFVSSVASPTPVSTVSEASDTEPADVKAKTEKETTFGNSANSLFGDASFGKTSSGSNIFGFSSSVSSLAVDNQSQGPLFGTGSGSLVSTQSSSGVATLSQSMPVQFGSSAMSPVFGTSGTSSFTTSSSLFSASTSASKLFGSGTGFGLSSSAAALESNAVSSSSTTSSIVSFGLSSSAPASETNSISSSNASTFSSSWQAKSPIFGSTFSSPSPSTGFSFGASSTSLAPANSAPVVFGSSTGALSSSIFSFTSTPPTSSLPSFSQTQPVFGNNTSVFTASSGSSDQMNMEDSMAEDPVQASTPAVPIYGQPLTSPSPGGFVFGSTAPSPAVPFQFVGQQNQVTPQNPSPFQASSSLDFSAGGSFSLGAGGGDKSNRKFVRVKNRTGRSKKN